MVAFQDHGKVELTLTRTSGTRGSCSWTWHAAGIDYEDVTETLEREGVQKFADSFDELLEESGRSAGSWRRSVARLRLASGGGKTMFPSRAPSLVDRTQPHAPLRVAAWAEESEEGKPPGFPLRPRSPRLIGTRRPMSVSRRNRSSSSGSGPTMRRSGLTSTQDKWLGWLDEPRRVLERVGEITEFAHEARTKFDTFVLLGMGGSSLAPEVLKRTFGKKQLHVLDTTHPAMIRHAEQSLDLAKTMFIVSLEVWDDARDAVALAAYFWEQTGDPEQFIVGHRSRLEARSSSRGAGDARVPRRADDRRPVLGVVALRYRSAALMGIEAERLLTNAERMAEACRSDANPGVATGPRARRRLAARPRQGVHRGDGRELRALGRAARSPSRRRASRAKGLIPAPGETSTARPPGRPRFILRTRMRSAASSSAGVRRSRCGSILGSTPFDQPDVQAAGRTRTKEVLASRRRSRSSSPRAHWTRLLASAVAAELRRDPGLHRSDPRTRAPAARRPRSRDELRRDEGLGPRYLRLDLAAGAGRPAEQAPVRPVVDDTGAEIPIPGEDFGFGRLIRAQAEGDFRSLQERGRQIVRVRLEDPLMQLGMIGLGRMGHGTTSAERAQA